MSSTKPRVLFVDDDRNFLNGIRNALRRQRGEWEMVFCESVDSALRHMRKAAFDAVAVDMKMPGKDGFAFLREHRASEQTREVPVVMLTGCHERDLKRRALDEGATDLLNKPVHAEDLRARLRSVLRLKAQQDELKALNLTLEHRVRRRTRELEAAHLDMVWRLAKAGEHRDEETGNHVVRVGCFCRAIAEALGMDRPFVEAVFLTGPLHDIGKIGIPDNILLKPGPLTPEEHWTMERHCEIGAKILLEEPRGVRPFLEWREADPDAAYVGPGSPLLATAGRIAMSHHERWDGAGYPQGLSGEEIPLEARITAVADVFDALTSARPYKPAYPHARAIGIMQDEVAAHFDPAVYNAFQSGLEELCDIQARFADTLTPALYP